MPSPTVARLTRERIVEAVTGLLEDAGVEAVSTRTIGEALQVHPTALYRHFRDMDELLREAADGILAGVVGAGSSSDQPEGLDAAAGLCRRLREVLLAHPGAARVVASGPSRFANERAITERLLALLDESQLKHHDVTPAYHALIGFTVGWAALDASDPEPSVEDVSARHRTWRASYLAASPADFPATVKFASQLYPSLDEQFEFGLELILSGLRERSNLNP